MDLEDPSLSIISEPGFEQTCRFRIGFNRVEATKENVDDVLKLVLVCFGLSWYFARFRVRPVFA
jgi:hypothetical protein